jgi:hypothetical protein
MVRRALRKAKKTHRRYDIHSENNSTWFDERLLNTYRPRNEAQLEGQQVPLNVGGKILPSTKLILSFELLFSLLQGRLRESARRDSCSQGPGRIQTGMETIIIHDE